MDTPLLQLERELFSLSPSETPRCLATRLERQLCYPMGVDRRVAESHAKVVPFRWSRIAAPAAAAVVVVSVLHQWDSSRPVTAANPPPGPGAIQGISRLPSGTGYVLKTEPVYVTPAGFETVTHQYWISGPENADTAYSQSPPRRQGFIEPVVFH